MANWIPITVADLKDAKLAALVRALQTAALESDPPQTDPTPRLTQAVVDRIRRKIASCSKNQLDADTTTIPIGLKTMAVDLIYAEMKGRLEMELTTDERDAISRHEADLKAIAKGDEVVEQPDSAIDAPVQATAGSPTISECRREKLRSQRNGL
jgi:hypothetical protein